MDAKMIETRLQKFRIACEEQGMEPIAVIGYKPGKNGQRGVAMVMSGPVLTSDYLDIIQTAIDEKRKDLKR